MPVVAKTWELLPHDPDAIGRLANQLRVSPIVAQLLLNRKVADPDLARRFLDTPLTGLHPPETLTDVPAAAERLHRAVEAKRRICVYGDYDVDGITGAAILLQLLQHLGANVDYYLPHRLEEGYGLNAEALRQLARDGTALVVTVDCGITSTFEADEARRLGVELIVTDHHEPKDKLPAADVLVHPRLPGTAYPFGGLSGAGVAFKLAWALAQRVSGGEKVLPQLRDYLLDAVALAALGLVADVVPLHDENRIFVKHGLARLQSKPSVGLAALMESAGLGESAPVRADDISFRLAPRLNAAGRLGCARMCVELLSTHSAERAKALAAYLEEQNVQRQQLERRISQQVREQVEAEGLDRMPALVLGSRDWHPGVIGIVAGRLADQYARPALLVAIREDTVGSPGSGRSIPGFALHEALKACSEDLLSHGGHAAAAGFRIRPDRIEAFREKFCAYTAAHFPAGLPPPRLVLDAEVPLSALTFGLLRDIDKLEPYGAQNPRPRFLAGGLQLVNDPRRIGGGERHLTFRVRQGSTSLRAIAWGLGERMDELLSAGGQCSLAFTPRINEWQGNKSVELEVVDFQPGANAKLG